MMLTSVHNPKIQHIRRLQAQGKARQEAQSFVIEGVRLAEEALSSGWPARQVLCTESLDERGRTVVDAFSRRGTTVEAVSEGVMKAVSVTEMPQGILVELLLQLLPLPRGMDFLLVLDGVRDPGNLGTILRTARGAGVQAVLLTPGCADPWSPKVVRSGMGVHFYLPIRQAGWAEVQAVLQQPGGRLKVHLADSAGGAAYTQADFRSPLALVIGGEAAGAGPEAQRMADDTVHIPMPGKSESLNAAIAAGIILFEVVRQRGS